MSVPSFEEKELMGMKDTAIFSAGVTQPISLTSSQKWMKCFDWSFFFKSLNWYEADTVKNDYYKKKKNNKSQKGKIGKDLRIWK